MSRWGAAGHGWELQAGCYQNRKRKVVRRTEGCWSLPPHERARRGAIGRGGGTGCFFGHAARRRAVVAFAWAPPSPAESRPDVAPPCIGKLYLNGAGMRNKKRPERGASRRCPRRLFVFVSLCFVFCVWFEQHVWGEGASCTPFSLKLRGSCRFAAEAAEGRRLRVEREKRTMRAGSGRAECLGCGRDFFAECDKKGCR